MCKVNILILIIAIGSLFNCCKKEPPPPTLPEIATSDAEIIVEDAVSYCSVGGEIFSNGGSRIISSGVCWSTHELPTISDSKYVTGQPTVLEKNPKVAVMGYFSCKFAGLQRLKTYYIRAFATNIVGTAYGNQVSVTTPCNEWMQQIRFMGSYPRNGVVVSGTSLTLTWMIYTFYASVNTRYDIYLATNPAPTTKIASDLSSESFTISALNPGTTYYWKIYSWETAYPCNNSTSEVFSFKTAP